VRFQDNAFAETTIPDATITYATSAGTDTDGNPRVAGAALSATDLSLFTNRLVRGTHHSWMTTGGNPVRSLKVRVSVKTEHAVYDVVATGDTLGQLPANESSSNTATNGRRHNKVNTEETHCEIELTNASNALDGSPFTATTVASTTPGELYILGEGGIAQYLFNALQAFQYDGEYAKVETEFANNVGLMNAVNFTGGRDEWTAMNAQPQSVTEDFGTRETFVRIGVSNHLTAGQLSSLLNMWAFRRPWYNPAVRADNSVANGGEVAMPQTAGGANATGGLANHNELVTTDYATPGDPTSSVNAQIKATAKKVADLLAATTPTPTGSFTTTDLKVIEPRECQFCDETGEVVNAILLVTGFYTKP